MSEGNAQATTVETPIANTEGQTPVETPIPTGQIDVEALANSVSPEDVPDNTPKVEVETKPNTEPETPPVVETKPEEEDKVFDPDKTEFDDGEIYNNIEGYDLEKFKDTLDFESEEALSYIKAEMAELKALGFNQAQAEKYIQSQLDAYSNTQKEGNQEEYSQKNVQAKLNESLTREEKGNYRSILNWMKEVSKDGAFPQEHITVLMSNPSTVKILNTLYKNVTSTNKVKDIPVSQPKAKMGAQDAVNKYKDWIVKESGASVDKTTDFVNQMRPYIDENELETFDEIFRAVTRKK